MLSSLFENKLMVAYYIKVFALDEQDIRLDTIIIYLFVTHQYLHVNS